MTVASRRHDPRRKDAGAGGRHGVIRDPSGYRRWGRLEQTEHRHRGVVVVDHLAICGLADQFGVHRPDLRGQVRHDPPLRGRRQRHPHLRLQAFEPKKRDPTAVFEQRDHCAGAGVVLLGPHARRRRRREDRATQVAAEFLQCVHGRAEGRLADEAHEHRWLAYHIDLAPVACGTGIPRVERRMRNPDPRGAGVRRGPMAPMPATATSRSRRIRRLIRIRRPIGGGRGVGGLGKARASQHVPRLLG